MGRIKKGTVGMPRAKKRKTVAELRALVTLSGPNGQRDPPPPPDPAPADAPPCAPSDSSLRKRLRAADAKVARASRSMIVEEHCFWRELQYLAMREALYGAKKRAGNKACEREDAAGNIERSQHWNLKVIEAQLDWGDDQIDFHESKGEYMEKRMALLVAKLEQRDAKIALLERRAKMNR